MRQGRQVVLVTGASSGIGLATARHLSARGYRVFGTSRRPIPGDENPFTMLPLDVCSDGSVKACVENVLREAGRIDVLVNNAGCMLSGLVEESGFEEAEAVFATDFWGTVRMTRAVLPAMRQRGAGRIINIGSLAGSIAAPGMGFYAATKAALARYTEALWCEVAGLGIRVSVIEPGFLRTSLYQSARQALDRISHYDDVRSVLGLRHGRDFGQGGDPHDVAKLVEKVIRARSPHLQYRVGTLAVWAPRLRALMPQRLFLHSYRRWFLGAPRRH